MHNSTHDTIALVGPLDGRSLGEIRRALYQRLGHCDVILDLTQADWIDAASMRMLVAATVAAQRAGHRLILRGCGPRVMRSLHMAGVRPRLDVETLSA